MRAQLDSGMNIRILLADDHQMVRSGLRALLKHEPGVEVVAEAEDGRSAVRLAGELSPDVVIMDISMPDLNGVDATRQIRKNHNGSGPKVIALSGHADRRYATEMLKSGATGYVLKDAAFRDLAAAVRLVVDNKIYLSPALAGVVIENCVNGRKEAGSSPFEKLTPREREILQLVAEGKAMKEIAVHLHISIKTVETHRKNVMEKLRIDSVAELTKYAIREGLTPL
jgi:two-component system response regulator NreC